MDASTTFSPSIEYIIERKFYSWILIGLGVFDDGDADGGDDVDDVEDGDCGEDSDGVDDVEYGDGRDDVDDVDDDDGDDVDDVDAERMSLTNDRFDFRRKILETDCFGIVI